MPTYVYKREDGSTFEIEQRITADSLTHCPTTGQRVERVISGGTGLIFKGSGFYLTDYARKNGSAPNSPSEKSGSDKSEESGSGSASVDSVAKKESTDATTKRESSESPKKSD